MIYIYIYIYIYTHHIYIIHSCSAELSCRGHGPPAGAASQSSAGGLEEQGPEGRARMGSGRRFLRSWHRIPSPIQYWYYLYLFIYTYICIYMLWMMYRSESILDIPNCKRWFCLGSILMRPNLRKLTLKMGSCPLDHQEKMWCPCWSELSWCKFKNNCTMVTMEIVRWCYLHQLIPVGGTTW